MENTLTQKSSLPYEAVEFDKINTADYVPAVKEAIAAHDREIEAITSSAQEPDFNNTIAALDRSGELLGRVTLTLSNLEAAVGSQELMDAMAEVSPLLSKHHTDIILNMQLWERIRSVHDNKSLLDSLTPEQRRLTRETYRDFAENGALLVGEARERFKEIKSELSDLAVKFSQNVSNQLSSPDKVLYASSDEVSGLPDDIKAAAAAAALRLNDGKEPEPSRRYAFTMYAPSYVPFMKYADNRELRRKLYMMYGSRNTKGDFDNTAILKRIANLRLELAEIMGKENFAQYQLQGTMAAETANVMALLDDLRDNYRQHMLAEIERLTDFARQSEGDSFELMPWDYSYWANKLKHRDFEFNDEDMKPYFELERTINGVFGLATKLYGFTFKRDESFPVYHPDVRTYRVYDNEGHILGLLYADFFYREGKSPGAWMTDFRGEKKDDGGNRTIPLVSIVCNFSAPVGEKEVLLTPGEVETFLHEFGHALHGLSAQAVYSSLSGTNVYHDFVELFSQFNENFLTRREFLDTFARHNKTGEPMPDNLLKRFEQSRQFGAAYNCMRQLGFGKLDMAWHTITEPVGDDGTVPDFEKKAINDVKVFDNVDGCMVSPSFGHIFSGGYAAGYYGYKWAEVLDADAFSAFLENGIFDPETASRYLKMMQTGGAEDPMKLYVEFRGKEPTVDALLKRDGIVKN